jgi:hypothetical protein
MATEAAPSRYGEASTGIADDDHGYGWLMFAGTMLMLLGTLNFIEGIAAVSKSHFFVGNAHYIFGDLKTWGWVVLLIGIAQGLIGVGIFFRNQFARWAGVAIAGLNAVAQLLFIPAYPFWALSLFAVDVLVIYGLVAYGARRASTA